MDNTEKIKEVFSKEKLEEAKKKKKKAKKKKKNTNKNSLNVTPPKRPWTTRLFYGPGSLWGAGGGYNTDVGGGDSGGGDGGGGGGE